MLKILALVCALSVSCSGVVMRRVAQDRAQEYETTAIQAIVETSVRIKVHCGPTNEVDGWGTGTIVSPRHVITARHIAEACGASDTPDMVWFEAVAATGETWELAVDKLATNPEVDAARLVTVNAGAFRRWAPIATYQPKIGQVIYFYGGDGNDDRPFHFKVGRVSWTYQDVLSVSIHGVPGNSGGGFFDTNGNLVGVLWGGVWHPAKENYAEGYRPNFWPELFPSFSPDLE